MVQSDSNREIKVFSGRSNPILAKRIVDTIGVPLGEVEIKNFSDGELWVKYKENIRGTDVFIIQSTNAPAENLLELLIMIDAAKRASAFRITAVIPFFGYARQDRKDQPRVAISSKLVANLITKAGADRVLTMDLHAPQIQGFFDIPMDHLYAAAIFIDHFKKMGIPDLVVASPDIGGIHLARAYASRLSSELAMLNKRRTGHNVCEVSELIGDVKGKNIIIVDDIIDTAGTLVSGVKVLKDKGAKSIYVACTHALLSGEAVNRIRESEITNLFISNSINIPETKMLNNMIVVCLSKLLAEAIIRIHADRSISDLFPLKGPMH